MHDNHIEHSYDVREMQIKTTHRFLSSLLQRITLVNKFYMPLLTALEIRFKSAVHIP